MKAAIVTLLIVFTFAFCFLIYWCSYLYKARSSGIITTGKIINIRKVNCNDSFCHKYRIEFNTTNDGLVQIELDLTEDYAKIGDTLEIMYLTEDPYKAQVVDDKMHNKNCIGGLILLLIFISGLIWCLLNMGKVQTFMDKYGGEPF